MMLRLIILVLMAGTLACPGQLLVGVGKRVVTPDPLLPVSGGIGPGKPVTKKLGDLEARAMVLEQGETRVAFVAVDFLGFPAVLGDRVRSLVPEIPGTHILIGASHTHSAPDCYGFPDELGVPGCDLPYLDRVCSLTAEAIREALESLAPARLKIATGEARGQIAFNYYAEELYDPRCSVIQAIGQGDHVLGTLVNYAIHPEVLGAGQGILSPDLVGPLRQYLESETDGMAMFINGALGGMVTADVRGPNGEHRRTWEECQRIGELLGREALRLIEEAPVQDEPGLHCHTRRVRFPVDSPELRQIIELSPLEHPIAGDGSVTTQINLVELGNARILTIPGEALPNIGYYLKRKLGGEHQLLFGLTNDAFGYILTKVDWNSFKRYDYITRTCLGEMTGEILIEEAMQMVREIDEGALSPGKGFLQGVLGPENGAWLGWGLQERDILEKSLEGPGVRVLDVAPGGPAQLTGIRSGDIITHWNGLPVEGTVDALRRQAGSLKAGDRATVTIRRGDKEHSVQIQAADREMYPWKMWNPDLPKFESSKELDALFEDHDNAFEALKERFDSLQGEAEVKEVPAADNDR